MPSENCLVGYLIIVNILFFGAAMVMLAFAVIEYRNPSQSAVFNQAQQSGSLSFKGVVAMVISGVKIFMAICAIIGAAMRSRMFLLVSAILLIADITIRIFLIALMSVAHTIMHKSASDEFQKVFHLYGNNGSDRDAVDFTKKIDDFMTANPCCGWSQNLDENLFFNSTWYRLTKGVNNLPAMCCTSRAMSDSRIADCLKAKDMTKARREGFIHPNNCLSIIMSSAYTYIYIMMTIDCLIIILNIIAIYVIRELSLMLSEVDIESYSGNVTTDY